MARATASVHRQAELLRKDGNSYFNKGFIGAAIDAFTGAIALDPSVAVYWTNRAVCHRKRNDWARVEEDCRKAIELDSSLVKAHYFLGLSLIEKHDYTNGIKELEKALELGRGKTPEGSKMEEIWETFSKAKFMEWEIESSERSWKMQRLKDKCEKALVEQHLLDVDVNGPSEEAEASHSKRLELLTEVFELASSSDVQSEVPDYLCCRITLDLLRDPVITPSGITYEKEILLDHLNRVGKFDPVTRESLEPHQLVPNLAIKEAVESFLKENAWAYKFC